MDDKPQSFARLPLAVITDHRLGVIDTRVLAALFSFQLHPGDAIWPSRETISERCGYAPRTISEAMTRLVLYGWIARRQTRGPNVIELLNPFDKQFPNQELFPISEQFPNQEPNSSRIGNPTVPESGTPIREKGREKRREVEKRDELSSLQKKVEKTRTRDPQKIDIDFSTGTWLHMSPEQKALWARAYPALSLDAELASAAAWLKANPSNRKSNYERFITNWLKRAQDRAPRVVVTPNRSAHAGVEGEVNRSAHAGLDPRRNPQPPRNRAERDQQANIAVLADWLSTKELK